MPVYLLQVQHRMKSTTWHKQRVEDVAAPAAEDIDDLAIVDHTAEEAAPDVGGEEAGLTADTVALEVIEENAEEAVA